MNTSHARFFKLATISAVVAGLIAVTGCATNTEPDDLDNADPSAETDGAPSEWASSGAGDDADSEDPTAADDGESVGQTSEAISACVDNCRGLDWRDVKNGKYSGKKSCCRVQLQIRGHAQGYCSFYTGKHYSTGSGVYSTWRVRPCNGWKCTGGRTVTKRCS